MTFFTTKEEVTKLPGAKRISRLSRSIKTGEGCLSWNGEWVEQNVLQPLAQDGIYPTTLETIRHFWSNHLYIIFKDDTDGLWRISK